MERFLSALGISLATEPSSGPSRNIHQTICILNGVHPFRDKKNLTPNGNKD